MTFPRVLIGLRVLQAGRSVLNKITARSRRRRRRLVENLVFHVKRQTDGSELNREQFGNIDFQQQKRSVTMIVFE